MNGVRIIFGKKIIDKIIIELLVIHWAGWHNMHHHAKFHQILVKWSGS